MIQIYGCLFLVVIMSNLFDIMSTAPNNESESMSFDDSDEEKMVDIDVLKQFTIPKKKKKIKG